MSFEVFLVVMTSSLFQAWWNFHLKKVTVDKAAFLLVGWSFFGAIGTPLSLLLIDQPFELQWLVFIFSTGLAQGLYLVLIAWAYTVADISVIYPIARGASIGLTALVLSFLGPTVLSQVGIFGISCVVLGAVSLGSVNFRQKEARTGVGLALGLALVVTTYSVIDSFGAQNIPLVFYVMSMNLTAPLFALPFLYRSRRKDIVIAWRDYKWQGFAVAAAGSFGYLIVIWAFKWAPAPYILALREASIIFAALLGFYYLKERIYRRKLLGIALIILGILFIKMA